MARALSVSDGDDAELTEVLQRAIANGYSKEDIFAAVQEVTIVAQNAIPPTTKTDGDATTRFLHLATVGILYEKGMLTERNQ